MNTLKLVSILILLCGVLSFSGCLGDGGNTLSVYSTGSIYKTSTGTSYMFIDRAGISATSAELILRHSHCIGFEILKLHFPQITLRNKLLVRFIFMIEFRIDRKDIFL